MKLILALALLLPNFAFAGQEMLTQSIKDAEAVRLWSALSGEENTKKLDLQSVKIECNKAERNCTLSVRKEKEEKGVYLYRDQSAKALYTALRTEEYEGRLGFTKIYAAFESDVEILCSRFYGVEGDQFSCTIDLGAK